MSGVTDYLLQHASGEYVSLLQLTNRLHGRYAERHGLTFVTSNGRRVPDWHFYWDKIDLLVEILERPDTGFVLWLDADAAAFGQRDPREALGDGVLGMTRHPGRSTPTTVNAGVMFLQACPHVVDLLHEAVARGPGVWPWYEQQIINDMLYAQEWQEGFVELGHTWNSTVILGHPLECEIRAWHGGGPVERRLNMMRTEIERRGL